MPITDALPDMQRELRFFSVENDAPQKLTRDQVRQFNEQGYICPLDIFTPEEAAANRRYFDGLMQKAREAGHNSYSINGWHRHCKGIYDLLHERRILDYVEDLLGPNLVSIMTHYFSKEPGEQKQVSWHQDASYWPLTPSKVVTVWLAIDEVDGGNGPMTVIPGSHLHGQIPFERSADDDDNVLSQSVHNPHKWGGEPVPFTMKAGQISMHTDLLLHGSEPNRSARRRCGLTLRYMPPEVRTREEKRANGYICRGKDPADYWVNGSVPAGDEIPQAQARS
jgi:ectoine hydroxylase-related dioxygenase (phytanoyl-CoA dioxygenase family)